jgi:TetR/AcrR family transcriptional regulator of autoinduction and epiphytic fitness
LSRPTPSSEAPTRTDPGRTDPRVARSHAAVMEAARSLLVELGPDGLTVDAVVARSGVAKSTVYRHWKTRDELVADVFADCMPSLDPAPDDLPAVDALRTMVRQIARSFADPGWQRLLPAMILLKSQSDEMAHLNEELRDRQREVATAVLRRCVEDGVLDPVALDDPDRTGLLLVGPLLAAALTGDENIDDALVDEVVDRFVRAYAPR